MDPEVEIASTRMDAGSGVQAEVAAGAALTLQGALDTIVANTARYLRRQKHTHIVKQIWVSILGMISEKVIDLRPYRHEPRAVKKRPKTFSYLTAPRSIFKEIPHRGKPRKFA